MIPASGQPRPAGRPTSPAGRSMRAPASSSSARSATTRPVTPSCSRSPMPASATSPSCATRPAQPRSARRRTWRRASRSSRCCPTTTPSRCPSRRTPASPRSGSGPLPTIDAGDLELALRYLPDHRIVVVAEPLDADALAAVIGDCSYVGALLVVILEPHGASPELPSDATAFEAPEARPGRHLRPDRRAIRGGARPGRPRAGGPRPGDGGSGLAVDAGLRSGRLDQLRAVVADVVDERAGRERGRARRRPTAGGDR